MMVLFFAVCGPKVDDIVGQRRDPSQ